MIAKNTNYTNSVKNFYNALAEKYNHKGNKNKYYHECLSRLYKFIIPDGQRVLELGCGTGKLLASVMPSKGVGIDLSDKMISIARRNYKNLIFQQGNVENIKINDKFDYIILSDLIGILNDIQACLQQIHKVTSEDSRIVISLNNYFWEPLFVLLTKLKIKTPQPKQSWLTVSDIKNLLELTDFEIIKTGNYMIIPFHIPLLSNFLNKYIARIPLINNFCFINYFIIRKKPKYPDNKEYSVSIILPARNEAGNIETGIKGIPNLGTHTQIIYIEDHSTDNTIEELEKAVNKYKKIKDVKYFVQNKEFGKAAAVRKGFDKATGDILIVFDSDLTTDPQDLPKFYNALKSKKAEFIQGSRLIYPTEKYAMRFLNILGNKFFSWAFSYLLDQTIKDTLCGTKAVFKKDYLKIKKNRSYFGELDPFGDFDLIFGSSKFNLKIMEIPIRYKAREYGRSNISRFRHGWLLLKMTFIAAKKIKFF